MNRLHIKEVTVENFKCFRQRTIPLSIPDGTTSGSGLNVLIGENGNGKTAFLEAVNYTTQSSFAAENRLDIGDFTDHKHPIRISIKTSDFRCKMAAPYMGCTFDCDGVEFHARSRDRKSAGKLLSPPFSISSTFKTKKPTYNRKDGTDSGKPIPSLHKRFGNGSIDGSEINVFYFDKNRTRQLSTGTYKTTFERICDDLNWKFVKNLQEADVAALLQNITGEFFSVAMSIAQKGTGEKLADEMADFFGQAQYKNLRIDLVLKHANGDG